ncbi:cilia- and flagella-associated protein 95-like isoform X2 [Engraulis encrasicolus]
MKKDYTVQLPTKMMIPSVLLQFDRDALPGCSQGCSHYNSALPRYPPGYNKMDFDTTHKLDYARPYHIQTDVVTVEKMAAAKPLPDFRRRQSEFTDVAEHKRVGQNTWQDDKGAQGRPRVIYAPRGGRNQSNFTLQ